MTALRTLRLSATGGTRTIGSMIASSIGGAGSPIRLFKFIQKQNNTSPDNYLFDYLGANRNLINNFRQFNDRFNYA